MLGCAVLRLKGHGLNHTAANVFITSQLSHCCVRVNCDEQGDAVMKEARKESMVFTSL